MTYPKALVAQLLAIATNIGNGALDKIVYRLADGTEMQIPRSAFFRSTGKPEDSHYVISGLIFESMMITLSGGYKPDNPRDGDIIITHNGKEYPIEVKALKHRISDVSGSESCVGRLHIIYWERERTATASIPTHRTNKGTLSPITRPEGIVG